MSDVDTVASEAPESHLSSQEQAYFDSRGEKGLDATEGGGGAAIEAPKQVDTVAKEEPLAPANGEDKARKVDYGALAEERGKRKALEERVRQFELRQAQWEGRLHAAQPQDKPKAPPAPEEDIFGAVAHLIEQNKATRGEIEAYKRHRAAEEQWQALGRQTAAAEASFKEKNPDYDEAWAHLIESRVGEMRWLGASDAQIQQKLQQDARS